MIKRGLIINHHSHYLKELHQLFIECDIVTYTHFTKEHAEKYDYIILSGGEINISGIDDIKEEKEFLRTTTKPIFGVCLGMQILSIVHGQILKDLPTRMKGLEKINIGIEGDIYYDHGCFIENVPANFYGIKKEFVKAIWNKNIFALQGHPELSGEFGKQIKQYFFENFIV